MRTCAECKNCNMGVLLPFYSPEGHVVYFCTNCRARFSAYNEEPLWEGMPIFSEMAEYTLRDSIDTGHTLTRGKLMDSIRELLEENPPRPRETLDVSTPYCSKGLMSDVDYLDLSSLPEI